MQAKVINKDGERHTFIVILDTEDEMMASLKGFVAREKLRAGQFSAIGAFQSALLGYFDWERKDYRRIPVSEQVEVASLIGDLATGPTASRPSIIIACWVAAMATPWPVICWRRTSARHSRSYGKIPRGICANGAMPIAGCL